MLGREQILASLQRPSPVKRELEHEGFPFLCLICIITVALRFSFCYYCCLLSKFYVLSIDQQQSQSQFILQPVATWVFLLV